MSRQGNGRSSIYKGADGHWHGRVTVGLTDEGRTDRRHVMSKTKAVVVAKVQALEKARDQGHLIRVSDRWTVGAWLDHWLENIARPFVRPSTYEGYRAAVHVHLIPGLGRHRLDALRPEHLERLYVSMLRLTTRRGTPMTPGRVHQVHRTMRAALNEAVKRGHIVRNPAKLAKTPAVEEHEVEPYTVAEVQQLFAEARNGRNGTRWVIALALGLRQGEALGLKWEDIDRQRCLLTIRRSRTRPRWGHGCDGRCGHKYGGHCPQRTAMRPDADLTKSKAGKRFVPLPGEILRLLDEHAGQQAAERQTAGSLWEDGGWIFTNEVGHPLNPRTDWTSWKQLLVRAGVRDGRLHDARHTAATVLLLLGVHERTIMAVLGWSTTAMVSRYAHVTAQIHRDVAVQLDGLLWASNRDQQSTGEDGEPGER